MSREPQNWRLVVAASGHYTEPQVLMFRTEGRLQAIRRRIEGAGRRIIKVQHRIDGQWQDVEVFNHEPAIGVEQAAGHEPRFADAIATAQAATQRASNIRDIISEARQAADWRTLGYETWADYVGGELGASITDPQAA